MTTSRRLMAGAAAGAAATLVLQPLRAVTAKRFPDTSPPMRREPGAFMIEQAESLLPTRVKEAIPARVNAAGAKGLALGYGMTFGALYALVRPTPSKLLLEGTALGLVAWAAGYLGWLPAAKLMPPVTQQRKKQVATPAAQHVVFGVAVVLALAAMNLGRELGRGGMPD